MVWQWSFLPPLLVPCSRRQSQPWKVVEMNGDHMQNSIFTHKSSPSMSNVSGCVAIDLEVPLFDDFAMFACVSLWEPDLSKNVRNQ